MERDDPADSEGTWPLGVERVSADRRARPTAQRDRHATPAVRELTPRGMDEQRRLVWASLLISAT